MRLTYFCTAQTSTFLHDFVKNAIVPDLAVEIAIFRLLSISVENKKNIRFLEEHINI